MAAGGAGLALDVGGGQHVLSQDEAAQARREGIEAAEHAVGELPARGVGPAPLQMLGRVLHADGPYVARLLPHGKVGAERDVALEGRLRGRGSWRQKRS